VQVSRVEGFESLIAGGFAHADRDGGARGIARSLARLQLAYDPQVGPPPVKATLQARDGQVLVFLPKRCLIDPTELQRPGGSDS